MSRRAISVVAFALLAIVQLPSTATAAFISCPAGTVLSGGVCVALSTSPASSTGTLGPVLAIGGSILTGVVLFRAATLSICQKRAMTQAEAQESVLLAPITLIRTLQALSSCGR